MREQRTFDKETLKTLVENSGRTKKWIAGEAGISKSALYSYMNGGCSPSLAVVLHFARIFECEIDDLYLSNAA